MSDRIEGLILKQTDYRENAVLLTVMTAAYGKISLVAHGARKLTSKNAASLMPYARIEFLFDYKDGRTIFRLQNARTVKLYRHLHEDLVLSAAAAVVCEVCDLLAYDTLDAETAARFYRETDQALAMLNGGTDPDVLLAVYISDMLQEAGLAPAADGCAVCGDVHVVGISAGAGGFVCAAHAAELNVPRQSVTRLRQFRLLNKVSLDQIGRLDGLIEKAGDDVAVLIDILRLHAGLEIRSFAFYQRLNAIE
ncbi:MAG: DNA repair protein RecO [Solobacterium sp.]|nr:DNA repair protein RecO [Solobacterium sp.]MBR0213896.1 DNA repair protein RecO [Solobacterium sp.]